MVAKGGDSGRLGFHKVLGTTVEAIVGGVYHQFVRCHFPRPPPRVLSFFLLFPREPRKPTNSSIPISSLTSS
jgi:hypothetical protein